MSWLFPVAAIALVVGAIVFVHRSARNFEKRKIARGEWDSDGPLSPTEPPPNFYPRALTGMRAFEVLNDTSASEGETDGDTGADSNESTGDAQRS